MEGSTPVVPEGVPPGNITDKLADLGLGALSKQAETAGVASEAIEQALDGDGPKEALISLIKAQSPICRCCGRHSFFSRCLALQPYR